MTEAELQNAVIDLAHLLHWRVAHFRPARTETGWRTPMQGDRGFPDLVLANGDLVVFAELKSDRGQVTDDQREWLTAVNVPGVLAVVWRPVDWVSGSIECALRSRSAALVHLDRSEEIDQPETPDHSSGKAE